MTYREQLEELARGYGADWEADAACLGLDPAIFFPEVGQNARVAKRVCSSCTVRIECLTTALERKERFGVWGGLTDKERRKVHRAGEKYQVIDLPAVSFGPEDSEDIA